MNTLAQDMFNLRYEELRKKLLKGKIRDKNLVLHWIRVVGNQTGNKAETEIAKLVIKNPYFKRVMSRQSAFEEAVLKDYREDGDK